MGFDDKSALAQRKRVDGMVSELSQRKIAIMTAHEQAMAQNRVRLDNQRKRRRELQVSLSLRFKGLFLHAAYILCHAEWYIRQFWCSFMIIYSITSIAYNHHTDLPS